MQSPTTPGDAARVAGCAPGPWYSCHILNSYPRNKVSVYDRLLVLKQTGGTAAASKRKTKRGLIEGISKKSRNRLLKVLGMVSRPESCWFTTLTTHENKTDAHESKKDFHRFRVHLAKRFPGACGVWRFAWQSRGAAHYHLLLWGLRDGRSRDFDPSPLLSHLWLQATGEHTDAAAREHAVDCVEVDNFRACGFYLALYQSSQESGHDDKDSGRTWGIIRRPLLALNAKFEHELSGNQTQFLRRTLRRHRHSWHRGKGKKGRVRSGPLGRPSGSYSAFLPVEEAERLLGFISKHVEWCERIVELEFPAQRTETGEIAAAHSKLTAASQT